MNGISQSSNNYLSGNFFIIFLCINIIFISNNYLYTLIQNHYVQSIIRYSKINCVVFLIFSTSVTMRNGYNVQMKIKIQVDCSLFCSVNETITRDLHLFLNERRNYPCNIMNYEWHIFMMMMMQLQRVYYVARILPKKQQTNPFRYTYHCIHRKLVKVQLLFRHFWPDVAFQQDLWLLLSSSMFWSKKQVFDSRQSLI